MIRLSTQYLSWNKLIANIDHPSKKHIFDKIPWEHRIRDIAIDKTNKLWDCVQNAFVYFCKEVRGVGHAVRIGVDEHPVH